MHHVPHRFPFEWIDVCEPGRVRVRLTLGASFGRQGSLSEFLGVEILAQACLAGLAQAAAEDRADGPVDLGLLAGIDKIDLLPPLRRSPLRAGDTLDVEVEQTGAFGRLVKVHGMLSRDGETVLQGALLLAL